MQWERSQATSVVPQLKYEVGCLERCTTVTSLRLEAKPGWVAAVWWILCALQPRRSRRAELADLEEQLAAAEARCAAMAKDAGAAEGLARTLALKQHELSLVDNRVKQSSHARLAAEVAAIDEGLAEARETIAQARETKKDAEAKAKALEKEVGNAAKARERQAKENDRKLAEAKQRHRDLVSARRDRESKPSPWRSRTRTRRRRRWRRAENSWRRRRRRAQRQQTPRRPSQPNSETSMRACLARWRRVGPLSRSRSERPPQGRRQGEQAAWGRSHRGEEAGA
mmetsp:Transcript_34033/g.73388  ORF Transcript_34033/g.73388 Transcript_34033/m.73388 type:complete len:283 (-) Transcript_34033:640-1488(-)